MALVIPNQSNVAVTPGTSVQVIATRVGRVGAILQVQADGSAWVALDSSVSKNSGFFVRGWEIVDLSVGFESVTGGALVEYYEGPISVLWEGGPVRRGEDPEPQQTANVRVIELTA